MNKTLLWLGLLSSLSFYSTSNKLLNDWFLYLLDLSANVTQVKKEISPKVNNILENINQVWIKEIISNKVITKVEKIISPKKEYILYRDKLIEEWFDESTKKILEQWIYNFFLNKTVYDWTKKIIITKEFLDLNKEIINENLKQFLIFLLEIESFGWKQWLENSISWAKGIVQWIDWYKNNKKNNYYNRKKWIYSSFETTLRRTDMFYNNWKFTDFKSEKTPERIKKLWKIWKINLNDFSRTEQINLFFTDVFVRKGRDFQLFIWASIWNKWAFQRLYQEVHHTDKSDEKTSFLVHNEIKDINLEKCKI